MPQNVSPFCGTFYRLGASWDQRTRTCIWV